MRKLSESCTITAMKMGYYSSEHLIRNNTLLQLSINVFYLEISDLSLEIALQIA